MVNSGFRRTSILGLATIALISSCGDNTAQQSALTSVSSSESSISVSSSESSTTVAATDPVSSDAVVMSDGSVCRPLPTPTSVSPDQAVGTTACTCSYDLFRSRLHRFVTSCYPSEHGRTLVVAWLHPA